MGAPVGAPAGGLILARAYCGRAAATGLIDAPVLRTWAQLQDVLRSTAVRCSYGVGAKTCAITLSSLSVAAHFGTCRCTVTAL